MSSPTDTPIRILPYPPPVTLARPSHSRAGQRATVCRITTERDANGETIELKMDDPVERGYFEKVYITYGKHSKQVIQFDIVEQ